MALTSYANELSFNWLLTTDTVTRPTAWYIAWHIGDPGDDGSANEQVVGNDADYVRQAVTFGPSSWSSILKSSISRNTSVVTIAPAAGASYNILGFSIWDAATGGNCFAQALSAASIPVSDTVPLSIIAGKIPVILGTNLSTVSLTSHGAALILDWLLTTGAATRPTSWNLGLHSADPGDDGSANEITTGDDSNYVRKVSGFNTAVTLTGSDTYTKNNTDSVWTPGAGANYTAPFVGVWDALTTGNSLAVLACDPVKIGLAAQTLSVAENELSVVARV